MRLGFKEFRKSPHSESTEFRKRFPADIQAATGKSHFTVSVGTITEKKAAAAYAKAYLDYEKRCKELRGRTAGEPIPSPAAKLGLSQATPSPLVLVNPAVAEEAIERWRLAEVGRAYMEIANGLVDVDPRGTEAMRRSDLCVALDQYQGYRKIADFDDRLIAALATQGITVPAGHLTLRMLRPVFRDAWLDTERYKDRMIRNPASVEPPPSAALCPANAAPSPPPIPASTSSASSPTLSELTEKWLKHHERPAKTQSKLRRCVRMLVAHLGGDLPVESITPMQLAEFYKAAVRLPARPQQRELSMSFQQLAAQDIPEPRRLTIQTVANWMNLLHSACTWGRRMRLIGFNPIADNKPSTKGVRQKHPTLVPTDEEITAFFGSSIYEDREKTPAWFWLPLLAVYTGARLNELGQLERADVVWSEIPYLNITTDTTEENDKDAPPRRAKTLKTGNSQRRVPLHPRLLELGFRDYWQSSNAFHLFPDLPHENLRDNDTPTQKFSRDFGRYLRKLGLRRGVKFHSFRHLFTDLADDMGVNPKARSILVGHANENDLTALLGSQMTDSYGSGYGRKSRLQFMLDEISKVHHPAIPALRAWR